jgi:hypothetical protein
MSEWLSSCVKEQPEVREALSDLADKIYKYGDAAKPTACREAVGSFWSPQLTLFRPEWKHFTVISIIFGIAGIIFSWPASNYPADKWADLLGKWTDLSLVITVQVFVLGISVVAIAQSISEEGSFVGEYLNDSCRTPWFCCLTLVAVLCGLVGHLVSTLIKDIPNVVIVGICMASVGAAIDCLAMLAFVIIETIRCSIPSESIKVVSQYAARKLTYGYVNDSYVNLFCDQQRSYLKKWCEGKAIHPPSQYCVPYIHPEHADNRVEIELGESISGHNVYKDYDLKGLERLDKYLRKNNAELYLSSPFFESERNVLGVLVHENVKQNEQLQSLVKKNGGRSIRYRKYNYLEKDEDFWDSQESKLNEAVKRAIGKVNPIQVKAYLDAVNVPLFVLRQVRKTHKVIRDAYGEYVQRAYQFLRLYLKALREILVMEESDQAYKLARKVLLSVLEETKNIFREMDYHTMELYTWLVQQMYTLIKDKDKGEKLQEMRAQFGGFYESAEYWFEDSESNDAEDVCKMRLVLHEGVTKWLLAAIEKEKNSELIEQLCNAGRRIVFGREGIKFDNKEVVAQHFVLSGHLIGLVQSKKVNTTAVERMFWERYSHEPDVNFYKLVKFYLDNSLPLEKLDTYLRIFYSPTEVHRNLLTGGSHSSGFGMTGGHEISLAFVFLAAHALKSVHPLPKPVAGMSRRITDSDIDAVSKGFGGVVKYGCEQLKEWLKSCDEVDEAKEDKEIAEARLDPAKVEEWETKFWEGYSSAIPVLSMCLKNGNYEIDKNTKREQHYLVPKIALYNYKSPISGADGNRYGFDIGHKMERNLLDTIIEGGNEESDIEGGVSKAIGEAIKWLEGEGCSNDKGIVILAGKRLPEIEMHGDKDFVPSWREEVKSMGFNGFYRGFPILWLREGDEDEGEESGGKEKKPQCQKVVAVDLRGWIGLKVRKEVVADRIFGELKVRTWTDEEIKQAIDSGKLEAKDADKAKGNCPVDVTFFWESIEGKLPRTRAFKFGSL